MSAELLTPKELEWLRRKATTAHDTEADTEWADSPLFGADEVLALFATLDLLSQELKAAREHQIRSSDGHKLTLSELKAAREALREYHHIVESDLIRDGWDHPISRCSCGEFECETAADLVSLSNRQSDIEERANRYQMQYEMECEIHGETRAEVQRLLSKLRDAGIE